MTHADVERRLMEAGATLLTLASPGLFPSIRMVADVPVVHDWQAYGWTGERASAPKPTPQQISEMDECLAWLNAHLPRHPATLKRIVGARMMVHPVTGRHLYTWRRLAQQMGADHKAVQRWHRQAVDLIVKALAHPPQKMACMQARSPMRARLPAEPAF